MHRRATKKLDLWQLPPHLIIHLKRFQVSGPWKDKINTPVDFPLTSLNLSRLVKGPDAAGAVYQLYAVSNHYGGLNGGHCACFPPLARHAHLTPRRPADTAFSQHSYRKSWHQYDDTLVSQVPASVISVRKARVHSACTLTSRHAVARCLPPLLRAHGHGDARPPLMRI